MTDKYNRDICEMAALVLSKEDSFGTPEYKLALHGLWIGIGSGGREQLKQLLFFGPVWDGNVCSKAARGILFEHDLAVRVSYKGDHGYTAATYRAASVFNATGLDRPDGYRQHVPPVE